MNQNADNTAIIDISNDETSDQISDQTSEVGPEISVENPYHAARFKPPRKGKKPPKLLAVVHQSGCTGCEVCVSSCPVDSIELVPGPDPENPQFRQVVEIDLARCIGCQNCSQECPWETITMYEHDDSYYAWSEETLWSNLYISEKRLIQIEENLKKEFLD